MAEPEKERIVYVRGRSGGGVAAAALLVLALLVILFLFFGRGLLHRGTTRTIDANVHVGAGMTG
ncbi:MAG TPA: hypothetical protein VGF77_00455 [Allosphingosinicella sp.]|jgi:hypothetical protein